jgi:hypothetical protein
MKAPGSENRKFSWATQRIHDLEVELERTKKALKVWLLLKGTYTSAFHSSSSKLSKSQISKVVAFTQELRAQAAQDKQHLDTLAMQQHGLIQLLENEKEAAEVSGSMAHSKRRINKYILCAFAPAACQLSHG